ncbi:hypothetical protein SDC9_157370 [bioreactor metagenome]|uniref:Uncharacterized protein n=1 Tax=bioreactor metagenome TaxID=1076179 RepID=A0A645F790_9ZZZZ
MSSLSSLSSLSLLPPLSSLSPLSSSLSGATSITTPSWTTLSPPISYCMLSMVWPSATAVTSLPLRVAELPPKTSILVAVLSVISIDVPPTAAPIRRSCAVFDFSRFILPPVTGILLLYTVMLFTSAKSLFVNSIICLEAFPAASSAIISKSIFALLFIFPISKVHSRSPVLNISDSMGFTFTPFSLKV